jgi:hypothetical protein
LDRSIMEQDADTVGKDGFGGADSRPDPGREQRIFAGGRHG